MKNLNIFIENNIDNIISIRQVYVSIFLSLKIDEGDAEAILCDNEIILQLVRIIDIVINIIYQFSVKKFIIVFIFIFPKIILRFILIYHL